MNATKVAVLRDTKEYLFENGWHQGHYQDTDGSVCLVGAYRMVQFGDVHCTSAEDKSIARALLGVIRSETGWDSVSDFNDAGATTFNDVIDIIDKTIKTLEG